MRRSTLWAIFGWGFGVLTVVATLPTSEAQAGNTDARALTRIAVALERIERRCTP